MRLLLAAFCAALSMSLPGMAEEAKPAETFKPLVLALPVSTDDCLKTLEAVLDHALAADLLDDQLDEAEGRFDTLETACIEGRFPEALEQAQAIDKLVSMNK